MGPVQKVSLPDGNDILHMIQFYVPGCDPDRIRREICTNVTQSEMAFFRLLPLPLKRFVLKIGAGLMGERLFTSPLSNLGVLDIPAPLCERIPKYRIMIQQTKLNTLYATTISYRGTMTWCQTGCAADRTAEQMLAQVLGELEIPFEMCER